MFPSPGDAVFDKGVRKLSEGADIPIYDAGICPTTTAPATGAGDTVTGARLSTSPRKRTRELVPYHHDPDHTDAMVDKMVADARKYYPGVRAAYEGLVIRLQPGLSASGA